MSNFYSQGEVLWLLSLSRAEAIDLDAHPRDSCSNLSSDGFHAGSNDDDFGIPVIARWVDVRVARAHVREREGAAQIMRLRAAGFTEEEVGRIVGTGRLNVHRTMHVALRAIVVELGERSEPDAPSMPSLCFVLGCPEPRARLVAVRRRVRGGWREVKPERQAGVCRLHLRDELLPRLAA